MLQKLITLSAIASLLSVTAARAIAQETGIAFEDSQKTMLTAGQDVSDLTADAEDGNASSLFAQTDGILIAGDGDGDGDGDGNGGRF